MYNSGTVNALHTHKQKGRAVSKSDSSSSQIKTSFDTLNADGVKCGRKTCSSNQRCCTTTVRGSTVYYCTTRDCSSDDKVQGDGRLVAETLP